MKSTINKQALQSATVQGYTKAVNTLFKLRSFAPPANLSDWNNMTAILINNMLREEDIVQQRAPLDNEIFAELQRSLLLVRVEIRLILFSLTLYLSVVTSVPI